ncbi:hypothetical protein [Gilvimarinus sp. DA14]|uniref:hypothetical protein n=1 Tax=Gilvimarinus sp. DA14 TaxID=2956798 RepID=UPI0020B8A21D|nr:hypothetical protein [Gilvimarinus sp. DA14]UTF60903.1 hypothetical protein NHM04_03635 [Gilvimarinus sp. DA14]
MPIDEIGSGLIGAIFRFFGWLLLDVVVEVLIKGLGYLLCRPFKKVDPDGFTALFVGMLAWVIIIVAVIVIVK